MDTPSEQGFARWTAPECPLVIEYSRRVLDDIRLAVADAFFSLPRGGAEIGGILLGRREEALITIVDSVPLNCEHAFGPGFVLSPRDLGKLRDLVAGAERAPHTKVVGWYHSHTRSGIFLSEADLEIHNRFFPQPWQIALVLKPHTFDPTRAGFFFREIDGSIHSAAPYSELTLDPLAVSPVPTAGGAAAAPALAPIIDVEVEKVVEPEPLAAPEIKPAPEPLRPPLPPSPPEPVLMPAPPLSRHWVAWAGVLFGAMLGGAAYTSRAEWIPIVHEWTAPPASSAAERLGLAASDRDGQLHIEWNGAARAAQEASRGSLRIVDGGQPIAVDLDGSRLRGGSFTYARRSGAVDVWLILPQASGKEVRETTAFLGAAPPVKEVEPAAPPKDDGLARENEKLRQDLARQVERNKLLEKSIEDLRRSVQRENQRRRLGVQSPEAAK